MNLQEKKLGVVVPIYNTERYLKQCLDSIIHQSYINLSILLIDDGSNDNSLNIAKNYALDDERIVIITKQNGGQASARNVGIEFFNGTYELIFKEKNENFYTFVLKNENVLGIEKIYQSRKFFNTKIQSSNFEFPKIDYIQFVDSDDFLELDCIEKCMQKMQDIDVLWFDYNHITELFFKKKALSQMQIYKITQEQIIDKKKWLELVKPYLFWFVWQGIIDFNFLKTIKLKFINGIIYEDNCFGILLFSMAQKIYIYPKIFYHYRLRYGSTTNYHSQKKINPDSYLYPLFLELDEDFYSFKKYQYAMSWILMSLYMIEFIHKNPKNSFLLKIQENFLPIMLDNSLSLLYLEKDPLNLLKKFEEFKPFFKKIRLSGSECFKSELNYRLGYVILMNYRNLKCLFSLLSIIKEEIKAYKKEKGIFKKNLTQFHYIHFIDDKLPNLQIQKVKNHASYKLGKIIVKFFVLFGIVRKHN